MSTSTNTKCVPLHKAALKGDWEHVQLQNYPRDELTSKITEKGETALHIAAAAKKFPFVESLVNHLNPVSQFLETENGNGNTALCYAAVSVGIATVMLEAHANELGVRASNDHNPLANCGKVKPLSMAALFGRCEMVKYLMDKTDIHAWSEQDRVELFTNCINIGQCGEALDMLDKYNDLAVADQNRDEETGLSVLARKPCAFLPQTQPCWRSCIIGLREDDKISISNAFELVRKLYHLSIANPDLEEEDKVQKVVRALFIAAEKGNVDFIIELIRLDPDLVWRSSTKAGNIFHIAIQHRHETIFNLSSELGSFQDLIATIIVDDGNKNMLHLAAELAPREQLNMVSGAALQMQRELLWFKVEKIVQPSFKEMVASDSKSTPHALFTERHKVLMAEGEKWMKETAKSSMVVAALIATVMFTTAFTVPGGYKNTGEPVLEKRRSFFVFSVADALALFCSSTSILMFHSILTSRYTETDFLKSLPFRLMVGVTALFVSVAAMMVAFCATFFLYCPKKKVPWMFGVSAIFACVPSMYVSLKYPLLLDLVRSNYASKFMFRSQRQLF